MGGQIKMEPKVIQYEGVDSIQLAQNMVMTLQVPGKEGNFLTSRAVSATQKGASFQWVSEWLRLLVKQIRYIS
jgi:hypothetical protein